MPYIPGDRLLLVTDDPDGLRVTAHEVSGVENRPGGQLVTVGRNEYAVTADGYGDHVGISVVPLTDELARELYLRGTDSLVILPTTTDPYDITQDRGGPEEDLRLEGPGR